MNSTALLLASAIVLLVAVLALGFLLFYSRAQLSATTAELDVATAKLRNRDDEIVRLRTMQARKVDRALFMLAKVRTERLEAPSELVRVELTLDATLGEALMRDQDDAHATVRTLIAEHLARRVARSSALTGGQAL